MSNISYAQTATAVFSSSSAVQTTQSTGSSSAKRKANSSTHDVKREANSQPIVVNQANPKRVGSQSYQRYEAYKYAKTKEEVRALGCTATDYLNDVRKGYIQESAVPTTQSDTIYNKNNELAAITEKNDTLNALVAEQQIILDENYETIVRAHGAHGATAAAATAVALAMAATMKQKLEQARDLMHKLMKQHENEIAKKNELIDEQKKKINDKNKLLCAVRLRLCPTANMIETDEIGLPMTETTFGGSFVEVVMDNTGIATTRDSIHHNSGIQSDAFIAAGAAIMHHQHREQRIEHTLYEGGSQV